MVVLLMASFASFPATPVYADSSMSTSQCLSLLRSSVVHDRPHPPPLSGRCLLFPQISILLCGHWLDSPGKCVSHSHLLARAIGDSNVILLYLGEHSLQACRRPADRLGNYSLEGLVIRLDFNSGTIHILMKVLFFSI